MKKRRKSYPIYGRKSKYLNKGVQYDITRKKEETNQAGYISSIYYIDNCHYDGLNTITIILRSMRKETCALFFQERRILCNYYY